MSLTNRLRNLELLMSSNKPQEMLCYQEDPTLSQLEVLCTFNAENSQEIYGRGAARKRLEFCDIMDCDYEESSADYESSLKRVEIVDVYSTLPHVIKPINFEQMTKQERGLVRNYAAICMDEDDGETCSAQFKRRRCQ